jgi:hypothetical protein
MKCGMARKDMVSLKSWLRDRTHLGNQVRSLLDELRSKSHPFTKAVSLDEEHASLLQCISDHCFTSPVKFMLAVLESTHRTAADAGTLGEFFLGPVEKSACGAALFGTQHVLDMGLRNKKNKIIYFGCGPTWLRHIEIEPR